MMREKQTASVVCMNEFCIHFVIRAVVVLGLVFLDFGYNHDMLIPDDSMYVKIISFSSIMY
jgi:hypothetical protein